MLDRTFVRAMVTALDDAMRQGILFEEESLDVSEADDATIHAWLEARLPPDDHLWVYWPFDGAGAVLSRETVTAAWQRDLLWLPGRDDVWIADSDAWRVVELDHEEVFRVLARRPAHVRGDLESDGLAHG